MTVNMFDLTGGRPRHRLQPWHRLGDRPRPRPGRRHGRPQRRRRRAAGGCPRRTRGRVRRGARSRDRLRRDGCRRRGGAGHQLGRGRGRAAHILVNNAGVQHRVPMLDLDVEDWERVLRTNLTSAFLVGREAARHMIPRGAGKIINVASVQTDLARPTIAPYTASKGGIRNLTRAMTAEWAEHGLQINAIAPGYIHTEMTQKLVDDTASTSGSSAAPPRTAGAPSMTSSARRCGSPPTLPTSSTVRSSSSTAA